MASGSRPANILVRVSRSMFCSSSCFTGRGSLSGPICYFVIMVMPPRERMLSTRGDLGIVEHKCIRSFAYDSVETHFNVIPLEVRKEILLLELESIEHPYHSDSNIADEDITRVPIPGRFRKLRFHFLSFLALHQQMDTLLHLIFRDK